MGANQTTLSSTSEGRVGGGGVGGVGGGALPPPPPSQDSIPETFETHPDLKQYTIEQRLLPGSGRMMRTYRIRAVNAAQTSSTGTFNSNRISTTKATTAVENNNMSTSSEYGNGVVAVCKSMWVHDSNSTIVQEQIQELQRIKEALHDEPHVMPFDYWTATNPALQMTAASSLKAANAANPRGDGNVASSSKDSAGNSNSSDNQRTAATTTSSFAAAVASATVGTVGVASSSVTATLRSENKYFCIYLVRSHVYTTLSDRLASRPFLTHVEKLYISYQILQALSHMHSKKVVHGFLTTENVGLTSWNYVVLVDIASYKAHTSLPDDDPSQYSYYYHSELVHTSNNVTPSSSSSSNNNATTTTTAINREKRCYIAPERFVSKKPHDNTPHRDDSQNEIATTTTAKKAPPVSSKIEADKQTKTKDRDKGASSSTETDSFNNNTGTGNLLKPSMDIFSCGCVLIETFLNGERALDLGELMEYRRLSSGNSNKSNIKNNKTEDSENDNNSNDNTSSSLTPSIQQKLNKIESSSLRAACKHMLQLNPQKRLTANHYLERLQASNVFPTTIFQLLNKILLNSTSMVAPSSKFGNNSIVTSDARIATAAANYGKVLWETIGVEDLEGERYFQRLLGRTFVALEESNDSNVEGENIPQGVKQDDANGSEKAAAAAATSTSAPEKADTLATEPTSTINTKPSGLLSNGSLFAETEALLKELDNFNLQDYSENFNMSTSSLVDTSTKSNATKIINKRPRFEKRTINCQNSIVMYIQLILSNIRHVQRPTSKIVGLQLLCHLCRFLGNQKKHIVSMSEDNDDGDCNTDNDHSEVLLQRIVPITISILEKDSDSVVKSVAMDLLTRALDCVQTFPPSDSKIFTQYIFKRISHLLTDPALIVRLSFIQNMPTIAQTALRFLDISYAVRIYEAVGNNVSKSNSTNVSRSGSSVGAVSTPVSATSKKGLTDVFGDDITKLLDQESSKKTTEKGTGSGNAASTNRQSTIAAATSSSVKGMAGTGDGANAGNKLIKNTYDEEVATLQETVSRWVVHITVDQSEHSSPMKRTLLQNIDSLSMFFGLDGIMTYILPQILTLFNDRKDFLLRVTLFERLPSVCYIIGRAATEHFVLPCLTSGLIDPVEHVIGCALKCLSELIQLGLLSRSILIGNMANVNTTRNNPLLTPSTRSVLDSSEKMDEQTPMQDGIIKKYGSLLVHPSAEVRHNAVIMMNTICAALGSPDIEVYVVRLIKPFLRFKPSPHHLCTLDGMEMCLYPPWDRKIFEKELMKYIPASPSKVASPGESGNREGDDSSSKKNHRWQSVGLYQLLKNNDDTDADGKPTSSDTEKATMESSSAVEDDVGGANLDNIPDAQIERMRDYLCMLGRNSIMHVRDNSNSGDENDKAIHLRLQLSGGMEGSLKLSQKIKIPRQDMIGSTLKAIPSWYSNLREKVRIEEQCSTAHVTTPSASSAIRSVSALGQVYGLSIMDPSENENGDGAKQEDDLNVAADTNDEQLSRLTDEDFASILRSNESRIIDAVCTGGWGSETHLDPALLDTTLLVTKLKALKVPPLPPNLGELSHPAASTRPIIPPSRPPPGKDAVISSADWKPKVDTFVATSSPITGHTAPVVRMAVSLDQSFFVSGSYDGTCRVWEMPQLERSVGLLESSATYSHEYNSNSNSSPTARINDLAMVEGSHSVVSGASDGTVHVWRVDLQPTKPSLNKSNETRSIRYDQDRSKVIGTSVVRELNPCEGEILNVSHFNLPSASLIAFGSQKGFVHSWDLRCCEEPFVLKHGPDIGYLTSMAVGNDRNWLVTGTSRGFLTLWDLRFHNAVKLWRHSHGAPVMRLATSFVPPPQSWGKKSNLANASRPFVFAACGPNECAMFDVIDGSCRECFRTVSHTGGGLTSNIEDVPFLQEIPISSSFSLRKSFLMTDNFASTNRNGFGSSPTKSINAMVGSIGATDQSYLITGGGDCRIRFWDFSTPSRCHVVSGQSSVQHRPSFERIDLDGPCRLMLCRQSKLPSNMGFGGTRTSKRVSNGLHSNINRQHSDAVQDLKIVHNALISCSRDCTIKIWR